MDMACVTPDGLILTGKPRDSRASGRWWSAVRVFPEAMPCTSERELEGVSSFACTHLHPIPFSASSSSLLQAINGARQHTAVVGQPRVTGRRVFAAGV